MDSQLKQEKEQQEMVQMVNFDNPPSEIRTDNTAHILSDRLDLLKDINIKLETHLGKCELSIAKLGQLKNGDVLTLDRSPDELVEITLGGAVIARGHLVVVGEYYGVRIEQITKVTL